MLFWTQQAYSCFLQIVFQREARKKLLLSDGRNKPLGYLPAHLGASEYPLIVFVELAF